MKIAQYIHVQKQKVDQQQHLVFPFTSGQSSELQQYSLPSTVAAELASMSGADSSACDPKLHASDRSSSSSTRDRAARQGRSSRRTEPSRRTRSRTPPASASASSTTSSSSAKPVKVDAGKWTVQASCHCSGT